MDADTVVVGRVVAPRGLRGEVKVEVMTDFPDRFAAEEEVYIAGTLRTIRSCRWHRGRVIIKVDGVDSVEAAEELRGRFVEVPVGWVRPLGADEYYGFQIVGMEVWTTGGDFIGRVSNILVTGGNDVYVVASAKGEVLVPAVDEVVRRVDVAGGRIEIEPVEGLLP
ncbi:MAG: ribosome maturation factor RimM [Chloroflexota bacterium]